MVAHLHDAITRRKSAYFGHTSNNPFSTLQEEQDRQYARGLKDDSNIAQKYERVAMSAKENAFFLGLKDHEQSQSYQQPEVVHDGDDDDNDHSVVSDLASQCSEDTQTKKARLRGIFSGISQRKKEKMRMRRRASM